MHEHDNLTRVAVSATLHCLTGCATGEIVGMIIGTAFGLSNTATIVISIVLQGGTAIYYKSRRKYVEAYVRETPDWIVQMQRAGIAV